MFAAFVVLTLTIIRLFVPLALMLLVGTLVQRRMNGSQAW